jgi:hypothetical protein
MEITLHSTATLGIGPHMLTVPGLGTVPLAGSGAVAIEQAELGATALKSIGVREISLEAVIAYGLTTGCNQGSELATQVAPTERGKRAIGIAACIVAVSLGGQCGTHLIPLALVIGSGSRLCREADATEQAQNQDQCQCKG